MKSDRQSAMSTTLQTALSRRRLVAGMGMALPIALGAGHLVRPESARAQSMETNSVVIGMHEDIEFLNVLYTQGGNSLSSSKLAQRGLLFTDADANWIGELAAEVPTLENGGVSEDGLTITYTLRDGVTWHDGEPVTAVDVKATWEMIMNPDYAVITRFGYDRIGSVEAPDPLTAVVTFDEPFASWPILFDAIIPKHVIEANADDLDTSEAMRQPVGFGPFKIVDWKVGESIEYEAFDGYWQGRPKLDRLFIRILPSVDTLMQAIEAKEIDIAWAMPSSYVTQIRDLESQGIKLVTAPAANAERLVMNADADLAPIFAEKELRQALQHAVNKQQIIDELLNGEGVIGVSEWQGSPWENTEMELYDFNPDTSRQMLDAAGWAVGGDGYREKDGQRLSFRNSTIVGSTTRENVQLLLQQMFKDIGVEMVIDNARDADLFGTWQQGGRWSHGEYDMGLWSHGLRVPDPEVSNRYLCSEIASEENPSGSQWYHYCNPEVDDLLHEQASTFDVEARKALIFQIQEILNEDAYWIYLHSANQIYSAPANLNNFTLHPFQNFYWNPQEWEWAAG
jgi:peptide/nickel transport system substrate-binding protein